MNNCWPIPKDNHCRQDIAITMTSHERRVLSNHQSLDCLFNSLGGHASNKHESMTYRPFVRGIHRWPVNSPLKGPVTGKIHLMASSWRATLQSFFICHADSEATLKNIGKCLTWIHTNNITKTSQSTTKPCICLTEYSISAHALYQILQWP